MIDIVDFICYTCTGLLNKQTTNQNIIKNGRKLPLKVHL